MMSRGAILVTGGAGFIGSHCCKLLARSGYLPVTLDNLSTGHADAVKWGPLIRADLREGAALAGALREHGVVAALHFAASAYVGESMLEPLAYYDNNLGGMIGLLAACEGAGVDKVILSSSCATYGVPETALISEDTPQKPINPYGMSKLMCERILADTHAAKGGSHVILRYFNAAGADPEGELRERHDPETHLIPLALLTAAGQREALSIFGTDYPTPDGTCLRDYIHVADLAQGHLAALEYLLHRDGAPIALNLGTGSGHSIRDIVAAIEDIAACLLPTREAPRRPGDPARLVADPARAREVLGFSARRSDIHTILRDAAPGVGLEVRDELRA